MEKDRLVHIIIIGFCYFFHVFGVNYCYGGGNSLLLDYCLYQFCHVNWWHLLANMYVMWVFRPRVSTIVVGYVVSIFASMVDDWMVGNVTCGASAMVFAMLARRTVAWSESLPLMFALIMTGMLVPGINWHVHLVAYVLGFIVWSVWYKIKMG